MTNLTTESDLARTLKKFTLETERLEYAYGSLKEHFVAVQTDLQEMREKLNSKLSELDFARCYLEAILSHISQGILFVDNNGLVTTYNNASEEILGIPTSQILFRPFWDFFPDNCFGFSLKEALETKKLPKTIFVTYTGKNTEKIELEVEATFVGTNANLCRIAGFPSAPVAIQGVLLLLRNITEFRRLQMVANRYDRLKELGEMAARVAHEIRNPLGGIRGFAALLQQDLKDQPELHQMATQIVDATDSLNRFVSQVLNYTRPFQPRFELRDLVAFLQEMLQLVKADRSFNSQISCEFIPLVPVLNLAMDPQLMQSAILNLLVNALQAMPHGGKLKLELTQEQNHALIKISDSGVGIPEEYLNKIFSPFFTTKEEGNGLGLSEVHKVIQAHSGSIEVDSTPGKGTIFKVTIPLKQ